MFEPVRTFRVQDEAEIIPRLKGIPAGLYRVTTAFEHTKGWRPLQRWYILAPPNAIWSPPDNMIWALQQVVK